MMNVLARAPRRRRPKPEDAAEDAGREVAVLDVVAGLVDDVEPLVELLDLLVALQLVEPAGRVLGDRGDLVGDHRDDRQQEQRHPEQEQHDHHRHGEAASHPPPLEPLDRGVEAGGQEQRDDDQDQYAADALELAEQPARQHEAETSRRSRCRRASGGRSAARDDRGRRDRARRRRVVGPRRRTVPATRVATRAGPGADLASEGGGPAGFRPPKIKRRPCRRPRTSCPTSCPTSWWTSLAARPSGTSESSPPKPATTSRSDAS